MFPGVTFYLSMWYRRRDVALRIAIFFSAATLAGAFGGLLAFAIEKMDGIGSVISLLVNESSTYSYPAGFKGGNGLYVARIPPATCTNTNLIVLLGRNCHCPRRFYRILLHA